MDKYDIFISYSRKDTAIADKICEALDKYGITYFIDRHGIAGGMEVPMVLADAIINSRLFLFLASRNSYDSKFTNSEISFAYNEKSRQSILPYIIDGSELPKNFRFIFSGINWRNLDEHPIDPVLIDDICALLGRKNNSSIGSTFFPSNTISMLIVMKNNVSIYYFRGRIYKDLRGAFINNHSRIPVLSVLKNEFFDNFVDYGDMSFDDFIFEYKQTIQNSDRVLATFLSLDDYFRMLSALNELEYKSVRVIRENSAVADFLSSHQEGEDEGREVVYSIHYDNNDTGFTCAEGVVEIRDDFDNLRKDSENYAKGKRFGFKDVTNLKVSLFGGLVKHYNRFIGLEKDSVLLETVPFDIYFGPKLESTIPKIIDAGTTIPTRKSETLCFIGTEQFCVKITDRIHFIDVVSDFGYAPKKIECTVECHASLQDIIFTIRNKDNNDLRSYKIKDLDMLYSEEMKDPKRT